MNHLRDAVAVLALQEQWTLDELLLQRRPVEEKLQAQREQYTAQQGALAASAEQLSRLVSARTFNPALASISRGQWTRQARQARETADTVEQLEREANALRAAAAAAQHRLRLMEDEAKRMRRQAAKEREASQATVIDDLWLQQHWRRRHGG